jgi:PAS domain S-box-containing protein
MASYRLGLTASVFAITFIELLALSISHYGGVFGLSLDARFLFGGIFLSLLPATLLAAYILLGIRAARSLVITLVAGLVGYTLTWMLGLTVASFLGQTPVGTLPTRPAWLLGTLGIVAETMGFFAVIPLYSFLGGRLRFPHWGRIAATLALVPLANGLVMLAGSLFYTVDSATYLIFATTLAARVVIGLLLTPGILIFLRTHLRGSTDAPLSVGPIDALSQLTSTRKSLEEAQARYQAMFAAAPDAILLFDQEGIIREINQRAEQELGYRPGELTGLPVWRLWGPTDDEAESERRIRIRLKNTRAGDVTQFEGIARRADGSRLPVEVSLAAVGGPMPEFLAIAHDLSRQKRDQGRLRQQVAELNTLAEVAHIASSARDVTGLLKASTDRVAQIVGADACYITLWDEARGHVVFSAASGPNHEPFRALAPATPDEGPSLTTDALAESHPVIVRDFPKSRYYRPRLVIGPVMQSVVALPLIGDGHKLGALVVGHFRPHNFAPEEVNTLERTANLIALAIGRMRLQQQTRERQQLAESLRQLGIAFGGTLDYDEILDRILDGLSQVMTCDAANIQLIQNGAARVIRSRGYADLGPLSHVAGMTLPLEDAPLLMALVETRRPMVVADVQAEPRWRVPVEWGARPQFWRSWVGAPVIVRGEVIGFINADSATPGAYTQRDAEVLALFAAQAAIALENSRLYAEAQEQRALSETLRQAAVVLGSTLDTEAILDRILVLLETVIPYDAANIQMIRQGRVILSRLRGYEKWGPDAERAAREAFFQVQDVPNLRHMLETGKPHFIADIWADPNWTKVPKLEWIRSWAAAPIVVRDEIIGFINVDGAVPGLYSQRHAELLAVFAQQAASALQNALLYTEAQEQRVIAETLRDAAIALAGTLGVEETLDRILELIGRVVPHDATNIRLIQDDRAVPVRIRGYEKFDAEAVDRETLVTLPGFANIQRMLQTQAPHYVADTWKHPEWVRIPPLDDWIRSWAGAPLILQGKVVGFLSTYSATPGLYSQRHADLLALFAGHAATALHNARLYEQTERRLQELTAIYESGRRLQRLQPPQSLAQEAINAMADILGYDHGSVMLTDRTTGDLRTVALSERNRDQASLDAEMSHIEGFGIRLGVGITGWVAQNGESILLGDVSGDPRYLAVRDDIRSELCVPLRVGEETIGVINVESVHPNEYTEADQRLLETVAAQVAIAIQNARLYEDLQRAYEQLKATQDEAMRAERLRALGQMASGIAHDFNNVLTPIMGYLELTLEHPNLPEEVRGDVERARRGTLAASSIVARLREFYRTREAAETFVPVEINRVVGEAVDLTRPRWRDIPQEQGVVIDVRLELGQIPHVLGDAAALRDLLTNLIINAVDAMPKGGVITIGTHKDADWVFLTVSDTGSGMTEEARQRAFEPFFSTKGSQGTGLGLSICYGIVQRHGGTIDLESAEGKGTTFFVRLPASAGTLPIGPEAGLPALPPLTILLVDDEQPVLAVVSRMLSRAGHKVIAALGGKAGIDMFVPGEVDIVITDLGMPKVTGREMARAVKARSPQTPVILLTGWGAKVGQEQGAPEEVDDILTKPVQSAELHRSLAKVLGLLPRE